MQNPSPQASDLQQCLRDIEFCMSLKVSFAPSRGLSTAAGLGGLAVRSWRHPSSVCQVKAQ
jgi:hypothetical protein